MNRAEKRAQRHAATIESFTIRSTSINAQSGLVAPKDRKCTDTCCGGFFWLTILAMLGVSIYCLAEGNITTLLAPLDGSKNICGLDAAENYPYLFFPDDQAPDLDSLFRSSICVSSCPRKNDQTDCF